MSSLETTHSIVRQVKVNQLVLFNGSASGIANLTIENNTFINLETNTGGYVNIGNLAKTSIKNNIFWTNTDGTGNVVIIRPQITSPTGDICADNLPLQNYDL